MIDAKQLRDSLARSGQALHAMADGMAPDEARWRPLPDAWSALEVVNHLLDEERDDFRTRLDITLRAVSGEKWPPIDPAGWVNARRYNERDLAESVAGFVAERENSLMWLDGMLDPDPETTYTGPRGTMRAGDLMASWAAHDLLHLRQLAEIRHAWLRELAKPYRPDYAGDW